jgi:hypothetical protein
LRAKAGSIIGLGVISRSYLEQKEPSNQFPLETVILLFVIRRENGKAFGRDRGQSRA